MSGFSQTTFKPLRNVHFISKVSVAHIRASNYLGANAFLHFLIHDDTNALRLLTLKKDKQTSFTYLFLT